MVKVLMFLCFLLEIRGVTAQTITSYDMTYRIKTSHNHISAPDSLTGIYYKQDYEAYYFHVLQDETAYIRLLKQQYKGLRLRLNDTIIYNNRPDINFRIRQVYRYRTVRRFKH